MSRRRPKKPRALVSHFKGSRRANMLLAEVRENIKRIEGAPVGEDLKAERDAMILGGRLFGYMTNKEQAHAAMKLSKWFFQYARWIASRPEGKV